MAVKFNLRFVLPVLLKFQLLALASTASVVDKGKVVTSVRQLTLLAESDPLQLQVVTETVDIEVQVEAAIDVAIGQNLVNLKTLLNRRLIGSRTV